MSRMRELLLDEYRVQLLSHGMDSCRNFEHLLEATLQQCITHPLHKFLFDKVKESLVAVGSYGQLEEAVENARKKTPEELGLRVSCAIILYSFVLFYNSLCVCIEREGEEREREVSLFYFLYFFLSKAHLLVPNDKSLSEIKSIFEKLKQTHCAMRKLEYLLEAVRLTYEGVKDVNNPKKIMNDLGADGNVVSVVTVVTVTLFRFPSAVCLGVGSLGFCISRDRGGVCVGTGPSLTLQR